MCIKLKGRSMRVGVYEQFHLVGFSWHARYYTYISLLPVLLLFENIS